MDKAFTDEDSSNNGNHCETDFAQEFTVLKGPEWVSMLRGPLRSLADTPFLTLLLRKSDRPMRGNTHNVEFILELCILAHTDKS